VNEKMRKKRKDGIMNQNVDCNRFLQQGKPYIVILELINIENRKGIDFINLFEQTTQRIILYNSELQFGCREEMTEQRKYLKE
jgi:hypothetical protein